MKLFKNKKGDAGGSGQQQLFFLAELIVGAILVAGGIYLTIDLTGSTQTEVITKDISTLINTITHQTNNLAYTYALPEFITQLEITKDTVTIHSNKGSTTHQLKIKDNIQFEPITLIEPDTLPIFFSYQDKTIKFEKGDKTDCRNLRLLNENQKHKITIQGTNTEKKILDEIKTYLESNDLREDIFSDEYDNAELEIKFGDEKNFTMIIPKQTEYEAINCYAQTMFERQEETENAIIKRENQDKITIKIGTLEDIQKLTNQEREDLLTMYSKQITQTIIRGKAN